MSHQCLSAVGERLRMAGDLVVRCGEVEDRDLAEVLGQIARLIGRAEGYLGCVGSDRSLRPACESSLRGGPRSVARRVRRVRRGARGEAAPGAGR